MARTDLQNAYSAELTSAVVPLDTSIFVDTNTAMTTPFYIVIDPFAPEREYILVTSVVGAGPFEFTGLTRGLAGTGSSSHDIADAVVSAPMEQHFDDLWDHLHDGVDGSAPLSLPHDLVSSTHTDVPVVALANRDVLTYDGAAAWNPRVKPEWQDVWQQAVTYELQDMVYDAGYLMIANKQTNERAAPQPVGSPFFATGLPDAPTWTDTSLVSNAITVGFRFTSLTAFQTAGFRVWAEIGPTYTPFVVTNPTTFPVTDTLAAITTQVEEWVDVPLSTQLVLAGAEFDIGLVITPDAPAETTLIATWAYKRTNGDPGGGEVNHQDSGAVMIFDDSSAGGNETAFLDTVKIGDTISAQGILWTIDSVIATAQRYDFGVTPAARIANEGDYAFTFTVTTPQSIPFVNIPNGWQPQSNVQGFVSSTGYDNIVLNENQYGVDLFVQDMAASVDWDLMNAIGSGGGGGGGGTAPAVGAPHIVSDSQPVGEAGLIWYAPATNAFRVWDGTVFDDVGGSGLFLPLAGGTLSGDLNAGGNDILSVGTLSATTVTATTVTGYLPLVGGALTGALTLSGDPTLAGHAARKQYVDDSIVSTFGTHNVGDEHTQYLDATDLDAAYARLDGATFTGALVLAGDPSAALQAATKQYVDNQVAGSFLPLSGGTMTGQILGAVGSVGAPGYAFAGDTALGMFRAGPQDLAFATQGVERLSLTLNGAVFQPPIVTNAGGQSAPGLQFTSANAGIYRVAGDVMRFKSVGGGSGSATYSVQISHDALTAVDANSQTLRSILVGTGVPDNAWGKDGDIYFRYTA